MTDTDWPGNVAGMSKSILSAIDANGWATRTWGGQIIATKDGHELTISDRSARWSAPYVGGGSYDAGIIEGVRGIVSVLTDPNQEI